MNIYSSFQYACTIWFAGAISTGLIIFVGIRSSMMACTSVKQRVKTQFGVNVHFFSEPPLGVNAADRVVAAESIELQKVGVVIESRYRDRLDGYGEWTDRVA
jgi:hypothetical protein